MVTIQPRHLYRRFKIANALKMVLAVNNVNKNARYVLCDIQYSSSGVLFGLRLLKIVTLQLEK